MFIRQTAAAVEVHAPAKLNIFLEVLRRRDDGFHDLETLFCPISLCDTLVVRRRESPEITFCLDASPLARTLGEEAARAISAGSDNLVPRAARLLQRSAHVACGASICLYKRIPAGAGLGGGSSDAAATLLACCAAWDLQLEHKHLHALAAELGSDVPAFLRKGPSCGFGRGDILVQAPRLGHLHFVVASPRRGLSTARVYAAWKQPERAKSLSSALAILARADWRALPHAVHNGLETAALSLAPWMAAMKAEYLRTACPAHAMTGSGSSWFGICRTARQARRLGDQLRARGLDAVHVSRCRI